MAWLRPATDHIDPTDPTDPTDPETVLLTRTISEWASAPAIDAAAAGLRLATTRRPAHHGHPGPVVALWPDWPLLAAATRLAGGHALVVVEGPALDLAGWAAQAGATDLTDGTTTIHRRPTSVESAMDTIHLNAAHSWAPGVGRQIAVTELRLLAEQGALDTDQLAAAMIARGHPWPAIAQLLRLAHWITAPTTGPRLRLPRDDPFTPPTNRHAPLPGGAEA